MIHSICRLCCLALLMLSVPSLADSKNFKLPVSLFAEKAELSSPTISLDGSRLAYIARKNRKEIIAIKNINTGEVSGIPIVSDAEIRWFRWANSDILMISYIYKSARNITRRSQWQTRLASYNTKKKKMTWLEDKLRGNYSRVNKDKGIYRPLIHDRIIHFLPDEPDHVLQLLNIDYDGHLTIRKVNIKTGKGKRVMEGRRGFSNYLFDQNKEIRVAFGYSYADKVYRYSYKSARTGEWAILEERPFQLNMEPFGVIAFTKDPEVAYVYSKSEHGTTSVVLMNLETKKIIKEIFSHPKLDVGGVLFTGPKGSSGLSTQGKISSVYYLDDVNKHHFLSKYSASVQKIVDNALPDTINTITSQNRSSKRFIILSRSPKDDGVYYLLDLKSSKLSPIGERRPGLNPKYLGDVKRVDIPVADGSTIPAYVTYPPTAKKTKLPTIIMPHGGPHARDNMYYDYLSQFLATRGYAVIRPNFRGSTGYGMAFKQKGIKQWGGLMQQDVENTTDWAIKSGIADKNNMCLVGWSYGGYTALIGAVQTPKRYKCFVSINGVSNIPAMKSGDKYKFAFGRDFIKEVGLSGAKDETVSPYHNAEKITNPVLLVATKSDARVPYAQSTSIHDKLSKRYLSELLLMDKGDHSILDEDNKIKLLNKLEEFIGKHLK